MTDVYERELRALRQDLTTRKDRVEGSLGALKNPQSEYAEDHRRMIRVYNAVLRTFEAEVAFERSFVERRKSSMEGNR